MSNRKTGDPLGAVTVGEMTTFARSASGTPLSTMSASFSASPAKYIWVDSSR